MPQVPTEPPKFMLTPRSMTIMKYDLWGLGIPYTKLVTDEVDNDEFNETCLMPFLTTVICVLASLIFFQPFIICILVHW